ncbi:MAG: hypothetical protein LBH95_02945 [Oscillospiraceae bacterium]|jgi:hypothetical protein|nr:hypothetical protein [Oscillospiraceae bacterium]
MTPDWLSEMGLSDGDSAFLREKWEAREREHGEAMGKLRDELESPFRAAGLVPGEAGDGLPETDGFLAGLGC